MSVSVGVILAVMAFFSQLAIADDECLRGTWKQEGETVFVCPNPGHGEWGGPVSRQEIAQPQKWRELKGKREFLSPGKASYYKNGRIVVVCADESMPLKSGWEICFDVKQSRYRFIKEVGVMILCK